MTIKIRLKENYEAIPNVFTGGMDVFDFDGLFIFDLDEIHSEDSLTTILKAYEQGYFHGYKTGELETLEAVKDSIVIDLEHQIKNLVTLQIFVNISLQNFHLNLAFLYTNQTKHKTKAINSLTIKVKSGNLFIRRQQNGY